MTNKILVIQFRTDKSLIHERQCILSGCGLPKSQFRFVNVLNSKTRIPKTKELDNYKATILGGSGQVNISDWSDKIKSKVLRVTPLLKEVVKKDKLTLGICFGHQLLAYILGGTIEDNPNQAETGTFQIHLNNNAKLQPIFKGLPTVFYAVLGHKNSVTRLPKKAMTLAKSEKCNIESYKIKNNIYCVQFHPELNKAGMRFRLNLFPNYANNKNIDEILKDYKPTPFATKLLNNFTKLITSNL